MYYKNSDYDVRTEIVDDREKYFIKFHGLNDSLEYEINLEIFRLYDKELNKSNSKKDKTFLKQAIDLLVYPLYWIQAIQEGGVRL